MLVDLFLLSIIFQYFVNINTLTISQIKSVSFNLPAWSSRLINAPIFNGTCEECLCTIVTNSSLFDSINIGSFNCFQKNKTCQFFSTDTFYDYWLNNDTNSTYYLFQIPTMINHSDLVAWHSFDGGSFNDSSGNGLNAIQAVNVLSVSGRIDQALNFHSNSSKYQIGGFTKLGQSNTPYSVALWVRAESFHEAPLVHLSAQSDGQGWCIDMLGFLTDGKLVARCWNLSPVIVNGSLLPVRVWNHVATTYSPSVGLRLYINGTLVDQSNPFTYSASSSTNYITLANSLLAQSGAACSSDMIAHTGTFQGLIDELRVYARDLSKDEILALANP